MNKDATNPPAFPTTTPFADEGMSLRDYFAAAVIGHLAVSELRQEMTLVQDAKYAYQMADAMLKERAK